MKSYSRDYFPKISINLHFKTVSDVPPWNNLIKRIVRKFSMWSDWICIGGQRNTVNETLR